MNLKKNRIDCSLESGLRETNITIKDLSKDVLVEILVRLPVKLAHQCKSVCKSWFNLISDPCFVRRQFSYSSQLPFMFIYEDMKNSNHNEIVSRETFVTSFSVMFGSCGFSLDFLPAHPVVLPPDAYAHAGADAEAIRVAIVNAGPSVLVKGSSGDLLLCSVHNFSQFLYYVCNPFTKQWVELPPNPRIYNNEVIIGFVCDTFSKSHASDAPYRYRVVRSRLLFSCFRDSDWYSFHMDVFFSETGKWSELDVRIPSRISSIANVLFQHRSFQNIGFVSNGGILHWIWGTQCIIAYDPFNTNNDECRLIYLPSELKQAVNLRLGVCKGRLRLLDLIIHQGEVYNRENILILRVWELEEYDEGKWCLVHDVRMELEDTSWLIYVINNSYPKYLTMSMAFHPYDGNVVYLWFPSTFITSNLQYETFQVVRDYKLNVAPKSVFPLVQQPWCPTSLVVSTLHSY